MRLLAIDASLGPCSAALVEDGRCIAVRHVPDAAAGRPTLAMMVAELLAGADGMPDAVAVTVGPGSFTGLRAALALAHGMALGIGVPIVGVTVAEALLAGRPSMPGRIDWVALDTHRAGRVFLDDGAGMVAALLSALPVPLQPVAVSGDAADVVVATLCRAGVDAVPTGIAAVDPCVVARVAARRLAGDLPACPAEPLYVEPPEAQASPALRPAPV